MVTRVSLDLKPRLINADRNFTTKSNKLVRSTLTILVCEVVWKTTTGSKITIFIFSSELSQFVGLN